MEVGVRELRNHTAHVIGAVRAGERVVLTVHGEPVADIVPHTRRAPSPSGAWVREQLSARQADSELSRNLHEWFGGFLDER